MNALVLRTLSVAALAAAASAVFAQDIVVDPSVLGRVDPDHTLSTLRAARTASGSQLSTGTQGVAPALPLWQYSVVSPRDGNTYSGAIVGGNPFNRGARTTTVQVVLIPVRIALTGVVRNFDPTSPDAGCIPAPAWTLTQQSPLLNTVPNYTMNGVNLGTTTFPDAFQRGQFWSQVSKVAPAYHSVFNVTVEPVQTITTANDQNGNGSSYVLNGCGTNAATDDNPGGRFAFMDINFIDTQLNTIIHDLHLTANQFPFFVTYRTYMTDGPPGGLSGNCCILGYHNTSLVVPANAPGQTYGIAAFDNGALFAGTSDMSVLSHEFMEWINDPSGVNLTPQWGNIGQVNGCQNNLEVGDPLSGTLMPAVAMPNGFTYHAQEQAYFSWFLGGASYGAGGKYSSNGTFTSVAANCP
jgi:hypothetical protein